MNLKFLPIVSSISVGAGLAWIAAFASPSAKSAPAASGAWVASVQHVIFISCDGLRGDFLESLIANRPAMYPNFKRLKEEGASTFQARTDYDYSETIPDHSCMLTGRPALDPAGQPPGTGHGFIWNTTTEVTDPTSTIHQPKSTTVLPYAYKSSVFDVVHEANLSTAFFHSKDRMTFFDRSYNGTYGAVGAPGAANPARDKIDRASGTVTGSTSAASALADFTTDLNTNTLAANTFLHFVDADKTGHASGWALSLPPASLTAWETAVKNCDTALGSLLAWLDNHPAEKAVTTIILTSDHGGGSPLKTHVDELKRENYTIPFFIHGPGFKGGRDAYEYFSNRSHPGTSRIADTAANPPIRNGDAANLSLTLLGLPCVPDSFFKPQLINPDSTTLLTITANQDHTLAVKWPLSATSYILETTLSLDAGPWVQVTTSITSANGMNIHTTDSSPGQAFFRLKKI